MARPVAARPAVRPVDRSRPSSRPYYRSSSYRRYQPYSYGSYGYYRSYPYWWGAYGWSPYYSSYWGSYYYGYPYYGGGYYRRYDPSDALGAARLQVTPRETEVFVDGYFAGVVDDFDGFSQRLRLEPGEHEVTLFLEGHRPLTRRMLFTVGQTFKVQHEMEALGAGESAPQRPVPTAKPATPARAGYGRPGIRSRPAPGRRGDPAMGDPSPRERDADVDVIEPNEPREVRPPVEPNEPRETRPRIERDGPPDERRGASGTLSIRVQPDDAEVLIDGEPWARSNGDRLIVALAPGVHRLEVRTSGHETYSGLVRIRPGVATTLNVALAPAESR
ncbi:MAG: PEGA domain-containing protein [Vicinamibacteraceae bacterium]